QQVWFIKLLGANVNLGNISHNEIIPLETLRIGLRGDTFFDYLNNK
ncbi:MAG: phosphosulfolactate synthase, partial [Flavobacteriales bacterium]